MGKASGEVQKGARDERGPGASASPLPASLLWTPPGYTLPLLRTVSMTMLLLSLAGYKTVFPFAGNCDSRSCPTMLWRLSSPPLYKQES